MSPLERGVVARREREEAQRRAVLARLCVRRGRAAEALGALLVRELGSAWGYGLCGVVLRSLEERGEAWRDADGLWRRRPNLDDWVRSLPWEVRARLSRHDLAVLRRRWQW